MFDQAKALFLLVGQHVWAAIGPHVFAAVPGHCVNPTAPGNLGNLADEVQGWVKWGVLVLIILAAIISIGSILIGRIFSHPHASRYGAMGLAIVIFAAILYVTILGILSGITKSGTGC